MFWVIINQNDSDPKTGNKIRAGGMHNLIFIFIFPHTRINDANEWPKYYNANANASRIRENQSQRQEHFLPQRTQKRQEQGHSYSEMMNEPSVTATYLGLSLPLLPPHTKTLHTYFTRVIILQTCAFLIWMFTSGRRPVGRSAKARSAPQIAPIEWQNETDPPAYKFRKHDTCASTHKQTCVWMEATWPWHCAQVRTI